MSVVAVVVNTIFSAAKKKIKEDFREEEKTMLNMFTHVRMFVLSRRTRNSPSMQQSIAASHWICELSIWRYFFFFVFRIENLFQTRWALPFYEFAEKVCSCFFFSFPFFHVIFGVNAIPNEIIHHFLYQCIERNQYTFQPVCAIVCSIASEIIYGRCRVAYQNCLLFK